MGGTPKKTQTDYTRGGHEISNTAIPYYENTLNKINDYVQNPTDTVDSLLSRYYDNTTAQSDFLRNYNRAMSNAAANNYAATGGGYSSSGQKAYNDAQRGWNDMGSRLYDAGVNSAANMQNMFYNQASNASGVFNSAYNTGKEYSDVEQYNYMADQANSFWNRFTNMSGEGLQAAGKALQFVPGVGTVAGAALAGAGGMMSSLATKPSDVYAAMGYGGGGQTAGNTSGWASALGQSTGLGLLANKKAGLDWLGRPLGTSTFTGDDGKKYMMNSEGLKIRL